MGKSSVQKLLAFICIIDEYDVGIIWYEGNAHVTSISLAMDAVWHVVCSEYYTLQIE